MPLGKSREATTIQINGESTQLDSASRAASCCVPEYKGGNKCVSCQAVAAEPRWPRRGEMLPT